MRESEPSSKAGIKCGDGQKIHRELKRLGAPSPRKEPEKMTDSLQGYSLSPSFYLLHLALSDYPNHSCDFAKTNI